MPSFPSPLHRRIQTRRPAATTTGVTGGLALVELVIMLVMLGLVAAIAVPRLGKAASHDQTLSVRGDLATLRNAIELYAADHNGAYPALNTFALQLTQTTNDHGQPAATGHGPYLQAIPALSAGPHAGETAVCPPPATLITSASTQTASVQTQTHSTPATPAGWCYDALSGHLWPNDPAWW
ncbi:MAG: hypothetical protein V3V20_08285 [Algisphaera sp.]